MPAYTTVYRQTIEHHPKEEEAAVYWVRKSRAKIADRSPGETGRFPAESPREQFQPSELYLYYSAVAGIFLYSLRRPFRFLLCLLRGSLELPTIVGCS